MPQMHLSCSHKLWKGTVKVNCGRDRLARLSGKGRVMRTYGRAVNKGDYYPYLTGEYPLL